MAVSYSAHHIAGLTGGTLKGNPPDDLRITVLLTDSRKVTFAQSAVFFALKTSKNDGHQFIGELLKKGVRCFVVSSLPPNTLWLNDAAFIVVNNTLEALQQLAALHRKNFAYPLLAITGSNGKTIVKEWLSQLLAPDIRIVKSPKSYNSQVGVPLSVWNMDDMHELGIFEAGISRTGEMKNLSRILHPQAGILTNIGPAHDEGFQNRTEKTLEKLELFESCDLLICCGDDHSTREVILQWVSQQPGVKLFFWGTGNHNDLHIIAQNISGDNCFLELQKGDTRYHYQIPFTDKASVENAMHCIAFILAGGYPSAGLARRLLQLQPLEMRLELKQGINNCILVNDAYISDILSLGIALDFLNSQVKEKKKILILSDIQQSGLDPSELYRRVATLLQEKNTGEVIGIGPELYNHRNVFSGINIQFFHGTDDFLASREHERFSNAGILIKGAREFGFERISRILQLKNHQTLLEINMDALVSNLNAYRSLLRPGVRLMATVKAFSYGSGSTEIASLLQFHRVDYLAVAFADEGIELRRSGITLPIVVLNPELHNQDVLFRYELEPEIYSPALLRQIASAAEEHEHHHAGNPFAVHIKLDTGMHRLGFMEDELDELVALLKKHPVLKVTSVFSHLAASDNAGFDPFSQSQMELFDSMSQKLEKELGYPFLRHIANSSAISRFPEAQYDMVRAGIGLYGIDNAAAMQGKLTPVATFKSVISRIKTVKAGESVGYNRATILSRDSVLALVPAGYADGLNRRLSRGAGKMMVNGQPAPITGNISMDMCTIDITGINAREGDEVIIFGKEIAVEEIARQLDTIPYEILTSIPQRVKRVYFYDS